MCGGGGGGVRGSSFMVRGVKRSVFCVQVDCERRHGGVKCYRYGSCIVTQ